MTAVAPVGSRSVTFSSLNATDGTKRITLQTYERCVYPNHYGEVLRLQWKAKDGKPAIAFQDESGATKAWVMAHDYLTYVGPGDPGNVRHKHVGIETTLADGSLVTRLGIGYDADTVDIITGTADFTVVDGTMRLAASAGSNGDIQLARTAGTSDEGAVHNWSKRWTFRVDSTSESGSNAGSNFKLFPSDDSGSALDTIIFAERANVNLGLAGMSSASSFGGGARVVGIGNANTAPTADPTNGALLFCQSGVLKVRASHATETMRIEAPAATKIPLILKGYTAQSADVQRWANVDGDVLAAVTASGGLRMLEQTDHAAPAANTGVVYVRDNGSGKSQLCVRFATGAVQVVATEP